MTIRILGDVRDGVGESPFWNPQGGNIWSVDITGKRLVMRDLETGETTVQDTDDLPTALVLDPDGGAIVSFAKDVARCAHSGVFGHLFRRHPATHTGVSGHL